jgi:uncharacterized membrane protein
VNRRFVEWLYSELVGLEGRGVLDAAVAARIREHYGVLPARNRTRTAMVIFSIIGSLCMGIGIILLLAHNWTHLSRSLRAVLAMAPLVVAQLIALHGQWRGQRSDAFREGIGTFLTLTIASSIALIGQTYHIPGNLGSFLLIWAVLTLPVVYLLNAALPLVIYLSCVTCWAGYAQDQTGSALLYWPLLFAAVPYLGRQLLRDPASPRSVGLGWLFCLALPLGMGMAMEYAVPGLWLIIYVSLAAIYFLVGGVVAPRTTLGRNPLRVVGSIALTVLVLLLCYEGVWDEIGWHHTHYGWRYKPAAAWVDYVLTALLPIVPIALGVTALRRRDAGVAAVALVVPLTILGYGIVTFADASLPGALLFNCYAVALALVWVGRGIGALSMGQMNGGLVLLGGWIICRFFDVEMEFLGRGIMFIVLGGCFLGANLWLGHRMKVVAEKEEVSV